MWSNSTWICSRWIFFTKVPWDSSPSNHRGGGVIWFTFFQAFYISKSKSPESWKWASSGDSWMYLDPNVPRHGKSLYKPYTSLYSGCLWVIIPKSPLTSFWGFEPFSSSRGGGWCRERGFSAAFDVLVWFLDNSVKAFLKYCRNRNPRVSKTWQKASFLLVFQGDCNKNEENEHMSP